MIERIVAYIEKLCKIPSPTGYTKECEAYLMEEFQAMGYEPYQTVKGSVVLPVKEGEGDGLLLSAHIDTLGLMVRSIKDNGRLRVTSLGGFPLNYVEQENVQVISRKGDKFTGVFRINQPAVHGSSDPKEVARTDENMELVLDEITSSKDQTRALGIGAGDFVALDPRFRRDNGFIKSRHLDDKAGVGILMALAQAIKEEGLEIKRPLYMMFTVYEEVGHGASSGHPKGIRDMVAVDMGVVYDDLESDETKLSICAKDSSGPYNFDLTNQLIGLAEDLGLDYAIDIYPHYGSDASAAMASDYDYRHALVGPGIAASHGYERTHERALKACYALVKGLVQA